MMEENGKGNKDIDHYYYFNRWPAGVTITLKATSIVAINVY
jgi:hypothetical protein